MNNSINDFSSLLSIHARVAVQLLTGDDYGDAARRAMMLIKACIAEQARAEERRRAESDDEMERNLDDAVKDPDNQPVRFNEAIKQITNQREIADATKCYKEFLAVGLGGDPETAKDQAQRIYERRKAEDGYTERLVQQDRKRYLDAFPKRHPKKKKQSQVALNKEAPCEIPKI